MQELYDSITVTPYRLRTPFLSTPLARLDLPLVFSRVLSYIAAVSASIAVFNLLPASGLDGEFTFQVSLSHVRPSLFLPHTLFHLLPVLSLGGEFALQVSLSLVYFSRTHTLSLSLQFAACVES